MAGTHDDDARQAVALFRHGLIADLAHLPSGACGMGDLLRERAGRDYDIVLVGPAELRRRLSMAVRESLRQRLVVRHHLAGLGRDELDAHLAHRLRLAGCELPLFDPPAAEALFQAFLGLPRLVNRIAHYALSAAALDDARTVSEAHMQRSLSMIPRIS